MHSLIVYESMYGNTHTVAARIGQGLGAFGEVTEVPVQFATDELFAQADLVLVGGPTHAHGVSSTATRRSAAQSAEKDESLELDPAAVGPGLRDWFKGIPDGHGKAAAAFDTRYDAAVILTGSAGRGIAHRLRTHGFVLVADPESFVVDKHTQLLPGEADRAQEWGATLAAAFSAAG